MSEVNGMSQEVVVCGKENSQTLFYLKKANSNSTALIEVDFSPSISQANQPLLDNIKLTPVFNKDGKYYTPAFIIEGDQKKYEVNDQGYNLVHEKKVREMVEEKIQIFVPKPSKANSYCCICKTPFQDYLTHINIPKHRQLLRGSSYYNLIANLCRQSFNITSQLDQSEGATAKTLIKKQRKTKKIEKMEKDQNQNMLKKGRGRPKKQLTKLDSLASISTSISIQV